jgi:hypothetical protein
MTQIINFFLVFPEQMAQQFPAFTDLKFITVVTRACHWLIQIFITFLLRSILILTSHPDYISLFSLPAFQ